MSSANLTVVKFVDAEIEGNKRFLFMKDGCRHCGTPTCLPACPLGAIKKNAKGMVYITAACDPSACKDPITGETPCQEACPFKNMAENPPLGIPRYQKNNGDPLPGGKANKCDFCYDRWGNAILKADPYLGYFARSNRPACQVACPTGAITTWKRGAARNKAIARVAYLQENGYPNANVYPVGLTTGVVWVLLEAPSEYGQVDA